MRGMAQDDAPMPGWVKLLAIAGLAVILVVAILHLAGVSFDHGGSHAPGHHGPSGHDAHGGSAQP